MLGEEDDGVFQKCSILKRFAEVDSQQRPLSAFLLADAIKRGEATIDIEDLLRKIITRERREFWVPEAARVGLGHNVLSIAKEERALALATIVDGLPRETLDGAVGDLLPRWDMDRHPLLFAAMTGERAIEAVPSLQPDLLGEFFSLDKLANADPGHARLILDAAWTLRPDETWWFIYRCCMDFASNPKLLGSVLYVPESTAASQNWVQCAKPLVEYLRQSNIPRFGERNVKDLENSNAAMHGSSLRKLWARAAVLGVRQLRTEDHVTAKALLEELYRLANDVDDEQQLWELWAMGAYNLIDGYCRLCIDAAELHVSLKRIAVKREWDASVAQWWGHSSVRIIEEQNVSGLQTALALFDELYIEAEEYRYRYSRERDVEKWLNDALSRAGVRIRNLLLQEVHLSDVELGIKGKSERLTKITGLANKARDYVNLDAPWAIALSSFLLEDATGNYGLAAQYDSSMFPDEIWSGAELIILEKTGAKNDEASVMNRIRDSWPRTSIVRIEMLRGVLDNYRRSSGKST